jgi:hypothetical protein
VDDDDNGGVVTVAAAAAAEDEEGAVVLAAAAPLAETVVSRSVSSGGDGDLLNRASGLVVRSFCSSRATVFAYL